MGLAVAVAPSTASAQQRGYTADRLILGTNPDDGFATWRPKMSDRTRFFGDMTFDYIRRPLKLKALTDNGNTQKANKSGVIDNQVNANASIGTELLGRVGLALTMPVSLVTTSNSPDAAPGVAGLNSVNPATTGAGDLRFDLRVLAYKTLNESFKLSLAASYFFGTSSSADTSFAGDGGSHGLIQVLTEEKIGQGPVGNLIVTQNIGFHIRDPHNLGQLGFQDELVFSAGIFIPLRIQGNHERVRVGASIYGSTGLSSSPVDGKGTFFKSRTTPVEWLGEARFALDQNQQVWAGGGAGTLVVPGYSAPDFRVIGTIGYHFGISDSPAKSPPPRYRADDTPPPPDKDPDSDGDGIPDNIDPCPTEAEDGKEPNPHDGCPGPKDRDGDGILDKDDKCPDQPEDRDGLADEDGCPEDDFDGDKILDEKDACPKEPGVASTDPKKNGCPQFISRVEGSTEIRILKNIEFDTSKATIKKDSFPIVDEVARLLQANKDIKKLSVEGHTDSMGNHDSNVKLSKDRAAAVLKYLIEKGVAADRLSSDGFGPDKPIDDNKTPIGRAKNRRVEFKILQ